MGAQSTDLQPLVLRARAGQPAAIAELYALYGDAVRRYCYVRLNDRDDAQDCVQEVFVRIWRGVSTFDYRGDGSFMAWLYTIAHHVVISHVRTQHRRPHVPLTPELINANVQHADTTGTSVDRVWVRDAIHQLTPEQQQVVTLKFFVGMSNIDIATAVGRTEGAVKALQHRAITRLHQLVQRDHALLVEDLRSSDVPV